MVDDLNIRSWLVGFLQEPRPRLSDGRSLYAYRCTDAEFKAIEGLLTSNLGSNEDHSRYVAAAFCLYAAEWWRRNYEGGPWGWEPIFSDLAARYEHARARRLTEDGLIWWRRPLRRSAHAREFLLSVILEGGFPVRVVQREQNRLTAYLKQVIRDLHRFGPDPVLAAELAARHAQTLPASLRQPEIFDLVGELLARALDHLDRLPEGVDDPVAWLDAHEPGWREELPLTVEDEDARRLLGGLIRESVRLRHQVRRLAALCQRRLERTTDGWRPAVAFTVDGQIDLDLLPTEVRQAVSGALRARLQPAGGLGEMVQQPLALLRPGTEGNHWIVEPLSGSSRATPLPPELPTEAVLAISQWETSAFVLPGGEPLDSCVWVFARDDGDVTDADAVPDRLILVGTGTVRSRRSYLYVAFDPSSVAARLDTRAELEPLGPVVGARRELYRLAGRSWFGRPEDDLQLEVRAAAETEQTLRFHLSTYPPKWSVVGAVASLGPPRTWVVDAHGTRRPAKPEALRWRVAGRGSWRALPGNDWPVGDIELALVEHDTLLDRARLTILPAGASVELFPEGKQSGRIVLNGFERARLRLEAGRLPSDVSVEVQGEKTGALEVRLTCLGLAPAHVTIAVLFEDGGESRFVVPFPARGGGFIDADDHWLPHYAHRSVQRLRGVRVQALGTGGEHGLLSGWLQAIDVQERWLFFRREFQREMPVTNLRRTIQRLLAASRAVDATVRLSARVGAWSSAELRVGRFDLQLREVDSWLSVEGLEGRCGEVDPDADVVVLTRPLYDFQVDEEPLLRRDGSTGPAWAFEVAQRGPGPWLVYGHVDGQYRIRPTVITVTDDPTLESAGDGRLSSLTRIADTRLRGEQICARLHVLATLPGDVDWIQLNRGLEALQGRLPLVCVDWFKLLPQVPEALITMLARAFGERVDAVLRIEDELPFGWVVLPMEIWQSTFSHVLEWRQHALVERGEEEARKMAVSALRLP